MNFNILSEEMKAQEKKHTKPTPDVPSKSTDAETAKAADRQNAPQPPSPSAANDADSPTDTPESNDVPSTPAGDNPATAENEPPAAALTPEMEALIAEAEQRGYMRGRNESIEELMRRPAMLQTIPPADTTIPETDEPMILGNQRISIWDR